MNVRSLARRLHDGKCLLFVGSDLAQLPTEDGHYTPRELVARKLEMLLDDRVPDGAVEEASRVSQRLDQWLHQRGIVRSTEHANLQLEMEEFLRVEFSRTRQLAIHLPSIAQGVLSSQKADLADIHSMVEDVFEQFHDVIPSLHEKLAALPFANYFTTSFDPFLINALAKAKGPNGGLKEPTKRFFNFRSTEERGVSDVIGSSVQNPLVYQLFGSVDDADSLVVTENDIIDYLVALGNQKLPLDIANQIADRGKVRLFLGFGLHHWHFRVILRIIDKEVNRLNNSHAFELEQLEGPDVAQARIFFSQPGHKITFSDLRADRFVEQLYDAYSEVKKSRTIRVPLDETTAQDEDLNEEEEDGDDPHKPLIFISYSHRDTPYMEAIRKELRQAGFRTWVDRDQLEYGLEWKDPLEEAIGKKVNYVVFLLSKQTQNPDASEAEPSQQEGYWKLEVKWAMDRREILKPRSFFIPVRVEDCGDYHDFQVNKIHYVDLPKDGYAALIRSIRRDWQRRHRD